MWLIDRSRIETDWFCARKRYWANEYDHGCGGALGLSTLGGAWDLEFGIVVHDALREIMGETEDPKKVVSDAFQKIVPIANRFNKNAGEEATLAAGLLTGAALHLKPLFDRTGESEFVEGELYVDIDEHTRVMVTPDLVLRGEAGLIYVEFKTTSRKDSTWIKSWDKAIQLHLGCEAIEDALGEPCSHALISGLYKGSMRAGSRVSPLVYGYRMPTTSGAFKYSGRWKRGWEKFPVSEFGIWQWGEYLLSEEPEVYIELFPFTPPIPKRTDVLEAFKRQQGARERIIKNWHDGDISMDEAFPQKFNKCIEAYGKKPCDFLEACWMPAVQANPLKAGYVPRQPHHQMEINHVKR